MGTTREEISAWFDRGLEQGATHLIVVCDSFDYEDYPVFVMPHEDAHAVAAEHSKNMQKVMEVYLLSMDKNEQLGSYRAFNYG